MINVGTPVITAIVPVRLSSNKIYDECERIERIVRTMPPSYTPLIVDYGTNDERKHELTDLGARLGVRVVRTETTTVPFSVGHARDIGTQHATTPLVMYHDIDFILSKENYKRVLYECRLRGMPDNAYQFFAMPGAYLTEAFSEQYIEMHERGDGYFADLLVHDAIMKNDKTIFDLNTYAISAIVANRLHLLAIGGHNPNFSGHGAEDFEIMHRLVSYFNKGPKTRNYYNNTKSNSITNYEGFRAYFALYGIEVFQRGIVFSHLWHPRRKDVGYVGTDNQARVSQVMRDYDGGKLYLPALPDLSTNDTTLVLVNPGSSPARALRHAYPAMGQFECLHENTFGTPSDLITFVRERGISRVFFLNPYGNEHRLALYRAVKKENIDFVTFDRGAYNDSWFFDAGGFLGESASYSRDRWDVPISDTKRNQVFNWIQEYRSSDNTLEKNGSRVGARSLREKLGVGNRSVLFVALQRPSDTATIYFSGQCGSAEEFNSWIERLASELDPRHFVVVVKKHPLESRRPSIDKVIFVDDETHILDLIEIADKTIVINSGTGLIAATLGKPVICCGNSFYAHEGFAFSASSVSELVKLARADLVQNEITRVKFVGYLVFDFYSFGVADYITSTEEDGGQRRIARNISFSVIRGLSPDPINLGVKPKGVSLDAPLFYSFGGRRGVSQSKPNEKIPARGPTKGQNIDQPRKLTSHERRVVFFVKPFVRLIGNNSEAAKFEREPRPYFRALSNPVYRVIGRILLP